MHLGLTPKDICDGMMVDRLHLIEEAVPPESDGLAVLLRLDHRVENLLHVRRMDLGQAADDCHRLALILHG